MPLLFQLKLKVSRFGVNMRTASFCGLRFWTVSFIVLVLVISSTLLQLSAASTPPSTFDWSAPASAKSLRNPIQPTRQNLQQGAQTFQDVCSTCHGEGGAGDGLLSRTLNPKPANLTDAKRMNRNSDGELFWKITNGRRAMPSWKQLPAKQRWQLVSYLRTLSRNTSNSRTQ
jgi:mono/diheme cytochrome c family protein